jgi:hypothetical protein
LPSEETTPPVMKIYRAMGPNLYRRSHDSTSAFPEWLPSTRRDKQGKRRDYRLFA